MSERMKPIIFINESLKRLVKNLKIEICAKEEDKKIIKKEIKEMIRLEKECERRIKSLTKEEIYLVGKVFGRLEGVYSLIMRGVENERNRRKD